MEIFAMIFAIFMIAAAIAATILIGVYAGGIWAAVIFAGGLIALYRIFTYSSGETAMLRDELNAYQRPLSDD